MEELNEFTYSMIKRMQDSEQKYKNHLDGVTSQLKDLVTNFQKKENNIEKTPKQNKKRPKRLSPIISEVTINDETEIVDSGRESTGSAGSLRPVRTTRGVTKCYKEPSVNTKLRRGDDMNATVKKERISEVGPKPITITKVQSLSKKNSEEKSKRSSSNSEKQEEAKKLDNSDVEILPNPEVGIIELDDEVDKMPPPSFIPPTKKVTRTTRQTRTNSQESITEEIVQVKEEVEPKPRGRPRTKKQKKIVEPIVVVKEEKKSLPKTIENEITEEIIESPPTVAVTRKTKSIEKTSPAKSVANTTIESIYEDAVGEGNTDSRMFKSKVVITTESTKTTVEETFICSNSKNDETFDLAKQNGSNDTYCVPASIGNETVVISKKSQSNETFCVPAAVGNETVVLKSQKKDSISSLISEDLSDEEIIKVSPEILKKTKKKNKNEVFNPFEQSPVKKKVEAFEKHVFNAESPVPQRVTRTKTKAKAEKENVAVEAELTKIPKYGTPTHQSYVAPAFLSQNNKKVIASASKLAHISKSVTKPSTSGRTTPSHSRDASVEDARRGLQILAEEKKKKREEKQKQAQLQRDLKEKEKREQTEKLAKEKEDKCKRLMQEKDLAREKIAKERKDRELEHKRILEEQKRADEARKLEFKMREERELAERREREHYEKMKAAQEESVKKMANIKLAQQAKILAISKLKKQHAVINMFDYLESGDSTEEEGKVSTKKPPPPKWSTGSRKDEALELQNYMSIKIIDNFFSVQPTTPDLSEIFPTIHVKYLKRNSSAVWNTPPRYSQMPKY